MLVLAQHILNFCLGTHIYAYILVKKGKETRGPDDL